MEMLPILLTTVRRPLAFTISAVTLMMLTLGSAAGAAESAPVAEVTSSYDALFGSSAMLRLGSRGAAVVDLQTVLIDLGYDPGTADGIFGSRTSAAVRSFQSDSGITADGLVGRATRDALDTALGEPAPDPGEDDETLRPGDRGPGVRDVQVSLNALGYDAGVSDGIYGGHTEAAVRAFQADQGLVVDGKVGRNTADTFEEIASIPPSSDGARPTIRRGNRGESVALAQRLLAAIDYDAGPADGIFGARTVDAAAAFQRVEGLTADGIIGPATWAALLRASDDLPPPPRPDPDCPPASASSAHPWRGEPCIERWRPLVRTYFDADQVDTALGVLRCESWGDAGALNPLSDTSGLFQHRPYTFNSSGGRIELWGPRYRRAVAWWAARGVTLPAGADIFDAETNIAVAAYLVHSQPNAGGWWHWGTFYGNAGCHDWVVATRS